MSAGRYWVRILRRGRAAWILLLGAGLLVAGASAASAFWTISVLWGSAPSAVVAAASLSAPTNFSAVQTGPGSVSLSWTAASSQPSAASYVVTRASGSGPSTVVCSTAAGGSSCIDSTVSAGTPYTWSVVAVVGTNWQSTTTTVAMTTLGITTTSLPIGNVGTGYSATPARVGGVGPFAWSLGGATLPSWATFSSSTGAISGTPTTPSTTAGLTLTVTDANGARATSGPLTLTVAKGGQTVSFTSTAPVSAIPLVTTYTATAVATSGLTVSLTIDSTSTGVCSVSSGVVTFLTEGTCRIDADQAGNGAYSAAPRVQQSITVAKVSQTVSISVPTDARKGGSYMPVVTSSSGLTASLSAGPNLAVCSWNGTVVSFADVGSCTVTAVVPGNASYLTTTFSTLPFDISTPAGIDLDVTSSTSLTAAGVDCGAVTANRVCTITNVGSSGSITFNVKVVSSLGKLVVFSYTADGTITQTGWDSGSAQILRGKSSTAPTTLTASHVGSATKTSTVTFVSGSTTYKLTINVIS